MADLKKLSDDQLDAASHKLMAQKDEIRAKQIAIHEERSRRAAEAREAAAAGEGGVVIDGVPAAASGGGS